MATRFRAALEMKIGGICMLYLYYTKLPDKIWTGDPVRGCRDGHYYDRATDDFCKSFIRDIDHTKVLSRTEVDSPIFGRTVISEISRVCHTLLMLYCDDRFYANASQFGHNCFPWIYKLSRMKDVHLYMDYPILWYGKDPETELICTVADTGEVYEYYDDYLALYATFNYLDDGTDLEPPYKNREEMFAAFAKARGNGDVKN